MNRFLALTLGIFLSMVAGATAQSAGELNAGSQLTYTGTTGAYTFAWWGVAGNTYLIQTSDDLVNWSYLPIVESGSSSVIEWGLTSTSTNLFLKLEYITIPPSQESGSVFDGPEDTTSDLPGDWELFYFGYLGVDPNMDPNGEGFTVMQDYEYGMNPDANVVVSVGPCVGEYPFNEITGTVAHDLSSLHNNGQLSGAAGWNDSGYDGSGAVTFDGTTAAVLVSNTGHQALPAAGAPFSLALWFEPGAGLTGTTALITAGSPGVSGFELGVDSTVSPPNVVFSTPGGGGVQMAAPIQSGAWSQAAVTYDGTNFTLYVDGAPQVTATGTLVSSTAAIVLGNGPTGVHPFAGEMENVRFYQAVLQDADVSSLYDLSTNGYSVDTSGLPNYWKYQYFGSLNVNPNGIVPWSVYVSPGNQQVTNLLAYSEGLNPIDFYNGSRPTLTLVSGVNQIGPAAGFVPTPLVVAVTASNGYPIAGAPVTFSVISGTLQTSSGGTPGTTVTALTNGSGDAQMFYQLPSGSSTNDQIIASTGTGATFTSGTFTVSNGTGQFISPFAPSDCLGVVNGNGNLIITWTNNTDNETSIYVEQQQSDGSWDEVASVGPGITSYTVMSPTPGAYRIDPQLPSGDPPAPPIFVQIPTLNYVPIAISGTYSSNVLAVALDDNNNSAFTFANGTISLWQDQDGNPIGQTTEYDSYTWQNGAVGSKTVISGTVLTNYTAEMSGTYTSWWFREPPDVTSAGNLYGTEPQWNFNGASEIDNTPGAAIYDGNGDIPIPNPVFTSTTGFNYESPNCSLIDVSNNGIMLGNAALSDTNGGGHSFSFVLTSGTPGLCTVFDTSSYSGLSYSNLVVSATTFYPKAVSNQGWATGYDSVGNAVVWTGTVTGSPSDFTQLYPITVPTAISACGQVVGVDATGTAGYLWTSSTTSSVCPLVISGSVQSIYSLIPPPYQGGILSVTPIDISGTNATDGSVRILFSGTYVTSVTPSVTGTAAGTFLLTLASGTSAITGGTSETIFQQVCLPAGTSVNLSQSGMLNSQGTIAALGTTGTIPGPSAILLFPVQFKNLGDPTERNGANYYDSQISFLQPLPSGTDTNINSVAWIAAVDTTETTDSNGFYPPRMPKLQAQIMGLSGYSVYWKLSVINHGLHGPNGNPYRDFDTGAPVSGSQVQILTSATETGSVGYSDDIHIPFPSNSGGAVVSGSWRSVSASTPWNIYEDSDWETAATRGFFGGDGVLSCEVVDSSSNTIVPEQDYKFRIAGENPFLSSTTGSGLCESYIIGTYGGKTADWGSVTFTSGTNPPSVPDYWFAYAIAKEETSLNGGRKWYNQFLDNGGFYSTPVPGREGYPNWHNDTTTRHPGTGGYGLFQLTFQPDETASYIMPRDWIWNWQTNVKEFLPIIKEKLQRTQNSVTYTESTNASFIDPSPFTRTEDTTTFKFWESAVITRYNGGRGWTFHPARRGPGTWRYLPNAENYLLEVTYKGIEGNP